MAKMHLTFDSESCTLHLTSNSHDWKFTMESRTNGEKEIFKFLAVMDQDRASYETERTWKTGHIIGSSKFSINVARYQISKDQTTSYDLKYPTIKWHTFDQPLTLTYETKNSGKTVFLTKIKFDFNIENKFVFEGSLSVPDQLPKDIDVLLSVIWKQSPTSFSVTGEWNSLNRNYKITSKYVYRLL